MQTQQYFMLVLLLVFSSCRITSPYKANNRVVNDVWNHYFNDELKVSCDFFGNTEAHSEISRKDFRRFKKVGQQYFPELKIKKENFLVLNKWDEGTRKICDLVFTFPPQPDIKEGRRIDSVAGQKYIQYPLHGQHNSYLYIYYYGYGPHSGKPDFLMRNQEAADVAESFKFDSNYVHYYPQNAFQLNSFAPQDSSNYLQTALMTRSNSNFSKNYVTEQERWEFLQAGLTYNAFIQNNPEQERLRAALAKRAVHFDHTIGYTDEQALRYIVDQCRDKRAVMLNEIHWESKCRYFADVLLNELRPSGFKYLAVEAVLENCDSLHARGYPLQSTGMYTKDPVFANMIRNAIRLGYTIVPYDLRSQDREYGQAKNIVDGTLALDPDAKVVVFAGFGHVRKDSASNASSLLMGYHLKKLTGIEPFVIDQTRLDYATVSPKNRKPPYYLAVADMEKDPNYDIRIINNYGYPAVMQVPGVPLHRIKLGLSGHSQDKFRQYGRLLVMIYNRGEFSKHQFDAVPVLNYLVQKDHPFDLSFGLPPGSYTFIVRAPTGYVAQREELEN